MVSASVDRLASATLGEKLLACLAEHGSGAHPYVGSETLLRGPEAARNLSDAVHFLCMLHGRYPGVVDHAASRCFDPQVRDWLRAAVEGFAGERGFLTRLASAAGPIPSTPGSAGSESAVLGQRHAIETLAQSERHGCATGAAIAVIMDWGIIRGALETAGGRFDIEPRPSRLPSPQEVAQFADASIKSASIERALMFGAQQILVQHLGLWDLLEARQEARAD